MANSCYTNYISNFEITIIDSTKKAHMVSDISI